eukprot:172423-Pelagomonas_calceolata.AAC.1
MIQPSRSMTSLRSPQASPRPVLNLSTTTEEVRGLQIASYMPECLDSLPAATPIMVCVRGYPVSKETLRVSWKARLHRYVRLQGQQ